MVRAPPFTNKSCHHRLASPPFAEGWDHSKNTCFLETMLRASPLPLLGPPQPPWGFQYLSVDRAATVDLHFQSWSEFVMQWVAAYMQQQFPYLNPVITSFFFFFFNLMHSIFCCSSSSCNYYISLSVGNILPLLKSCCSDFSVIPGCSCCRDRFSECRAASGWCQLQVSIFSWSTLPSQGRKN